MITHIEVGTFNGASELRHFRRFLPAPLSDAAQAFWASKPDGARDNVTEFLMHQEQFSPVDAALAQRLTFQLLRIPPDVLGSSVIENLINLVHLASSTHSLALDIWLTEVTGVELVSEAS